MLDKLSKNQRENLEGCSKYDERKRASEQKGKGSAANVIMFMVCDY